MLSLSGDSGAVDSDAAGNHRGQALKALTET